MTDTPFLILHKVRGLPAFDIATRCDDMGTDSDPGPWWIIPTSGHRAYPAAHWHLEDLSDISDYPHERPFEIEVSVDTLPDHYSVNDRQTKAEPKTSLISLLGLAKKIIRRV